MADVVEEPTTGLRFPRFFQPPPGAGGPPPLEAMGTGLRDAKVLGVKVWVYAVACHVDPAGARAELAEFRDRSVATLAHDETLFKKLIDGPFDMCLSMCFYRDITHSQFVNGIEEALAPRLHALSAPPKTLKDFLTALNSLPSTRKGSRVFVSLQHPDRIHVSGLKASDVPHDLSVPPGVETHTISCAQLGKALRDVYFGPETVAPSLRDSLAQGAAALEG